VVFLAIAVCTTTGIFSANHVWAQEKIGVLFLAAGLSEDYELDWRVQFYDHIYPAWPDGFLAGGPKEGATCYTAIHYANDDEAFICGVPEGTPIDAFCNAYTGPYEVHSLRDHWGPTGDGTFFDDCYPQLIPAAVFTGAHSTIDPVTLEEIEGPHIDDPAGSGIGIADFVEITSFEFMEFLAHAPDNKNPTNIQELKWFYGNDTPGSYGYPPDTPELTNVKDALIAAMPGTTFVFRHGSEGQMKNLDAYGNPTYLPYSTETALEEFIHTDNVDRIVVLLAAPDDSNLTQTGPCWRDGNGQGVSALPNKTYRECLEDFTDGKGPQTQEALDDYYVKPWKELLKIPYPEIEHLAHKIDPEADVDFARPLNKWEGFELAVLETVNHTIAKYSIPDSASLRVIVSAHGLTTPGWKNVLECDSYFRTIDDLNNRLIARIESGISRTGALEVVGGEAEFAEAKEDRPSVSKPFGDIWSSGELLDEAINGTYVNELGQVVDNGTDNFDYVIVIPISWISESTDTLDHGRGGLFGNNEYTVFDGQPAYGRQHDDGDGMHYDAGDFDTEYFTVKVFDGTGWPSIPGCIEDPTNCETNNAPVYKGAPAPNATTAILTGTVLALGNGAPRTHLTDAAVDSIIEAVQNPGIGGSPDPVCEDITDGDGFSDEEDNCPSTYNPGQEDTLPPGGNGIGDACDCECDFNCDRNVDGLDVDAFLTDFGRNTFSNPCTNVSPCNGDVNCDANVDATDVTNFLGDFGRNQFNNPCPSCVVEPWCQYPAQ
jgi:hypothetical protein